VTLRVRKQLLTGLLFVGVGGCFAYAATAHRLGTTLQMGPGFFPFWVGLFLVLVGLVTLVRSAFETGTMGPFSIAVRPLVAIIASIVAFGLLLPILGLYLAVLATVIASSRADGQFPLWVAAALGVCLAIASDLVFVRGLGLPLPLFPAFFQV
jgi:hypothetical protein